MVFINSSYDVIECLFCDVVKHSQETLCAKNWDGINKGVTAAPARRGSIEAARLKKIWML